MKLKLQIVETLTAPDPALEHENILFNVDLNLKFKPDNMALFNVICKEMERQEKELDK